MRHFWIIAAAGILLFPHTSQAYLEFTATVRNQMVPLKWGRTPVSWSATDRGTAGVSASEFQAAIARAFATWERVPTASITFQFAGFTGAEPMEDDSMSVIGFGEAPELERVLGATDFVVDTVTGEIVEADIFFNSAQAWSTAQAGDPARYDLQSVALHEIGHFLGLGHSALGETELRPDGARRVIASGSVMFPIAFGRGITLDRELQPDDIAGVSDLYPDGGFLANTGIAHGRVLRDGRGVFGAHVIAFSLETGRLIGGFTVNRNGEFLIGGLTPGPHVIRVEPLDDADLVSFFGARDPVAIDFQPAFYDRLYVAPKGGAGPSFDIPVRSK